MQVTRICRHGAKHLTVALALCATSFMACIAAAAEDPKKDEKVRLLERQPVFDVVTIASSDGTIRIETQIIDFPGGEHVVPDPLPTSGSLEIRRLGEPGSPYAVPWAKVQKIELWEEMLADEAVQLTKAGEFGEAFEYLAYLHNFYPKLAGLEEITQTHLVLEARHAFQDEQYSDSLSIMMALYDRNPAHPSLAAAVPAVSDQLIEKHWTAGDYAAARSSLDLLARAFPKLKLSNVPKWAQRFQAGAKQEMDKATAEFQTGDYGAARDAVRAARAILPNISGGRELLQKIQDVAPEIRVGVSQFGRPVIGKAASFADARAAALSQPKLIDLVGNNGDSQLDYRFRWGNLRTDESGLETSLQFSAAALQQGLSPESAALRIIAMSDADNAFYEPAFAALLDHVSIGEGRSAYIAWKRPHIRPAALLQTPLQGLSNPTNGTSALWFNGELSRDNANEMRFSRGASPLPDSTKSGPRFVVERLFSDDEALLTALIRGNVDAVDRMPPWQLDRADRANGVVVSAYAAPTVHVLKVNWGRRLLDIREYRRALCFAIDRDAIVRDVLLAGQSRPGFRAVSGPFPPGLGPTDPIAYAYKPELSVRPYEPSLAQALVGMAEGTLAKQEEEARKAANDDSTADNEPSDRDASDDEASEDAGKANAADEPLRLLHGPDPLARLACQSIKLYLDQAGIRVSLHELAGDESADDVPHDLRYMELAVWEPLVDARKLLGAGGLAGRSSAYMNFALAKLEEAENWNQAASRLKEIHEIAHYDLPLIPLWQTVNHFAHRDALQGVGEQPITLYQNLSDWTKSFSDEGSP